MNLLFFGSSGFSVQCLAALRPSVSLVVTRRTKPKGRGYALEDNAVKKAALSFGLPVSEIDSFRDEGAKALVEPAPDLLVVVSFGLIIPRWFLDKAAIGAINVHPSLLPAYRGPSPIQWAVLNGDAETGVTVISMTERMDAGDILYQERVAIGHEEDSASLSQRLASKAAEVLPAVVERVKTEGTGYGRAQDDGRASYTAMVTKDMGRIDWTRSADSIARQVRAFVSWPTACTLLDGKTMKVYRVKAPPGPYPHKTHPGTVVAVSQEGIEVSAGVGSLVMEEVQMENKKRMAACDFARGYRGLVGKRLA